ncbi:MAG TPA: retropepsin-like aspartic protease [Rhizomicrobium sp.]|nr:retropepsin-like aspartic protease [Rhizomicrobium sp.]
MQKALFALAILAAGSANAGSDRLWSSFRAQDFFALRSELPAAQPGEPGDIRFLRAASLAAFGRTQESERLLTALLAHPLADSALEGRARELLMLDRRAEFRYAPALEAIAPLLKDDAGGELRNRAKFLRAVADVPAQSVRPGQGGALPADRAGRVRILLGRGAADMMIDTGANFSVISRSAALGLGLRVRRADYGIGSSTGGQVQADVAAASFAFADGTRVDNAVFLVLPDRSLKMANGETADGLIGQPVIAALGTVAFRAGHVVLGLQAGSDAATAELALAGNDPLLRVSYRGQEVLCRLDTGSDRSVFYAPFYQRFRDTLGAGRNRSERIGSATGMRSFHAQQIGAMQISIGGRAVTLGRATVLSEPIGATTNTALACDLGRDAFAGLAYYAIDLKRMTLTLG